jgi:15-cis-phytoene synthase
MAMQLYHSTCSKVSTMITRRYSTSFSLGVRMLDKRYREPIYAIYGFVRFADEIVDTFHGHDKATLLTRFKEDTWHAIEDGISLNPVLHSFQATVRQYGIGRDLIETFLRSMEMDLDRTGYDQQGYEDYILGSAEVVGLMCLRVFCNGDDQVYNDLRGQAMKLGSAFQKINFLRDLKADYQDLGRTYFPGVDISRMDAETKRLIEEDIRKDFDEGLAGIRRLPKGSRLGVYVAYAYYRKLFAKICNLPPMHIMESRVRIPNQRKLALLVGSYLRHQIGVL